MVHWNSPTMEIKWGRIVHMENLRCANTEPSMHFMETNTDPSMHFEKDYTNPSMHFRKAIQSFCSQFHSQLLLTMSLPSLLLF